MNCLPACVSYFICSEKSNIATGAFCRFLIRVLFAFRGFLSDKRRLLSAHKRNLFSLSESSKLAKFGFHRTETKRVLARFKANNTLLYRHTQLLVKLQLVSVDKQNWSLNPVIDLHQLWCEQSNLQHPKGGSIALLTPHSHPPKESIRRSTRCHPLTLHFRSSADVQHIPPEHNAPALSGSKLSYRWQVQGYEGSADVWVITAIFTPSCHFYTSVQDVDIKHKAVNAGI